MENESKEMNEKETFTIKELLYKLDIVPDDIQVVSDGEYGYLILLTSNLTEKMCKLSFKGIVPKK